MGNISNAEMVYQALRERIISNEIEPGQILTETLIATEYNVSRTPVREALRRLSGEGFVVVLSKLGIQVTNISMLQVKEGFEIRRVLEALAAKLLLKRVTQADIDELEDISNRWKKDNISMTHAKYDKLMHKKLWELSGNASLIKMLEDLHNHEERWWHYMHRTNPNVNFFSYVGDDHPFINIIECIKNRDEDGLLIALAEHLDYYIEQARKEIF